MEVVRSERILSVFILKVEPTGFADGEYEREESRI